MSLYRKTALNDLRREMTEEGIDWYLATSSDCHASEYVGDYFKVTEFLSGCTSDNVVLAVGREEAYLWTDGRYFLSAEAELEGSGITLMREGEPDVPAVEAFLRERLSGSSHTEEQSGRAGKVKQQVLAFDGRQVDAARGAVWRETASAVRGDADLISRIWTDHPARSAEPVRILPEELCGKSFAEKLAELREDLAAAGAEYLVLSRLDDIMWLTNLRGKDIPYNPVALSYAFAAPDAFVLFLQDAAVTEELRSYAEETGITLAPYDGVFPYLRAYEFPEGSRILLDKGGSTDAMWELFREKESAGLFVLDRKNPTTYRKAVKNAVETAHIREFYLKDSVALCRFLYEMKTRPTGVRMTEMDAARRLDALRAEIPGFLGLSFPTIPACGPNAAMAHYAPEGEGTELPGEGFLLVDSGGQYLGATTDVTRTIALGPLTDDMKRDFTLVLAGHLRLMNAVFKKGTTGSQLDLLAREPLYAHGLDYNHGTGHGIGYILNVHEGPQRIGSVRPGAEQVPIEAGMITSDEPGIYRTGQYGIRTESILLAVSHAQTEFGTFLAFECLTFAPVDRDAIDPAYLTAEDLASLNAYHRLVHEKIAPHLSDEEREWLYEATREIVPDEAPV